MAYDYVPAGAAAITATPAGELRVEASQRISLYPLACRLFPLAFGIPNPESRIPSQYIRSNQASSITWNFFARALPPAVTTTVYSPTSAGMAPPNVG